MKLDIPAGEFAAYIFDLDGTLIDTMPLHYRAWDAAMRRAGLPHELDEELFYSLGGVPTLKVAELIGQHYGLKIDPLAIFEHKESLFKALQKDAKLIEPTVAFFARQAALTHPLAIRFGRPARYGETPHSSSRASRRCSRSWSRPMTSSTASPRPTCFCSPRN